jgi:hypothetical protein
MWRRAGLGAAFLLGLLMGGLLWAGVLGAHAQRHAAGLWTLRFERGLDCGIDYNGPPFTSDRRTLWLFCGEDDTSRQIWPP